MVKPEIAGVGMAVGVGASVAVADGGAADGIGVSVTGGSGVRVAVGIIGVDDRSGISVTGGGGVRVAVGKVGVDDGSGISVAEGSDVCVDVGKAGVDDGIGVAVAEGNDVRLAVAFAGVSDGIGVSVANGNKVAVVVAANAPVAMGLATGAVPVRAGVSDASDVSVTRGAGVATCASSVAEGDACTFADVGGGTTVNPAPSDTASGAAGEVALDRNTNGVSVASIVREGAITDRHTSSRMNNSRTDAIATINAGLPVMAGCASCYSVHLRRRQAVRIVM